MPADATPVISKQLYQLLVNAAKNDMYGELETAVQRGVVVSERAQYYLLAMQTAIRGQDDLDLEEAQNQRLLEVQRNINTLLVRKNKGAAGSMVPASLSYSTGSRWSIQEAAIKQMMHQIVDMRTILPDTMNKLFADLSAVTDVGTNSVVQYMAMTLLFVFRALKASVSAQTNLTRFMQLLEAWKPMTKPGIDIVLSSVAKLVLSNPEVRSSSRPFVPL
jgi:hypothetical protein